MTVYVVHPINDKSIDISGAKVYGELEFVNKRYIYLDELEHDRIPSNFNDAMLRAVDRFEPDEDYLLIAGDHLQLVAMTAMLAGRWDFFKVLRYDREARGYAPIEISSNFYLGE